MLFIIFDLSFFRMALYYTYILLTAYKNLVNLMKDQLVSVSFVFSLYSSDSKTYNHTFTEETRL